MGNHRMDKKERLELKLDIKLLLECLDYQKEDSGGMKQALVTLSSMLQGSDTAKDLFRETNGLQAVLSLVNSCHYDEVKEAGLYCLGSAVERNVHSQKLVTTASMFTFLHGILSATTASTLRKKQTATFLMLCLVSNNVYGQNLARQSSTLHDILSLIRTTLPKKMKPVDAEWFEDLNGTNIGLWSAVVSTACACVNNPLNDENQHICSSLIPYLFSLLSGQSEERIVKPVLSLLAATVNGNVTNQDRVRKCGGFEILVKKLSSLIESQSREIPSLVVQILATIDTCITDNEASCKRFGQLGGLGLIQRLFTDYVMTDADKIQAVLTLAHSVEACSCNQKYIEKSGGLTVLIQLLTEATDEELCKTVKYLLHMCVTSEKCETDHQNSGENMTDSQVMVTRMEAMKRHNDMEVLKKINELDSKLKSMEKTQNTSVLEPFSELPRNPLLSRVPSETQCNTSVCADELDRDMSVCSSHSNYQNCPAPGEQSLLQQLNKEKHEKEKLEKLNHMLQENLCNSRSLRNQTYSQDSPCRDDQNASSVTSMAYQMPSKVTQELRNSSDKTPNHSSLPSMDNQPYSRNPAIPDFSGDNNNNSHYWKANSEKQNAFESFNQPYTTVSSDVGQKSFEDNSKYYRPHASIGRSDGNSNLQSNANRSQKLHQMNGILQAHGQPVSIVYSAVDISDGNGNTKWMRSHGSQQYRADNPSLVSKTSKANSSEVPNRLNHLGPSSGNPFLVPKASKVNSSEVPNRLNHLGPSSGNPFLVAKASKANSSEVPNRLNHLGPSSGKPFLVANTSNINSSDVQSRLNHLGPFKGNQCMREADSAVNSNNDSNNHYLPYYDDPSDNTMVGPHDLSKATGIANYEADGLDNRKGKGLLAEDKQLSSAIEGNEMWIYTATALNLSTRSDENGNEQTDTIDKYSDIGANASFESDGNIGAKSQDKNIKPVPMQELPLDKGIGEMPLPKTQKKSIKARSKVTLNRHAEIQCGTPYINEINRDDEELAEIKYNDGSCQTETPRIPINKKAPPASNRKMSPASNVNYNRGNDKSMDKAVPKLKQPVAVPGNGDSVQMSTSDSQPSTSNRPVRTDGNKEIRQDLQPKTCPKNQNKITTKKQFHGFAQPCTVPIDPEVAMTNDNFEEVPVFAKPKALPPRSKIRMTPTIGSCKTQKKPKVGAVMELHNGPSDINNSSNECDLDSNPSIKSDFDNTLVRKVKRPNLRPVLKAKKGKMASSRAKDSKAHRAPVIGQPSQVIKSQNNVGKIDRYVDGRERNAADAWTTDSRYSPENQQSIVPPRPAFSDCGMRRHVLCSTPYRVKSFGRRRSLDAESRLDSLPEDLNHSPVDSNIDCFRSSSDISDVEENCQPNIGIAVLRSSKRKKPMKSHDCPGCSAISQTTGRLNSRTYNVSLETDPNTCPMHRKLRQIERLYIYRVNKAKTRRQKLKSKRPSRFESVTEKRRSQDSVYNFSSDSNHEISPISEDEQSQQAVPRPPRKKKLRRQRIDYTHREIENLMDGVRTLGKNWNQILLTYHFHPSRTNVDIKDKYKNIMAARKRERNSVSHQSKGSLARKPFSMCEERRLKRGILKYGCSWKTILESFNFAPERTTEDLRNRWRTLYKKK